MILVMITCRKRLHSVCFTALRSMEGVLWCLFWYIKASFAILIYIIGLIYRLYGWHFVQCLLYEVVCCNGRGGWWQGYYPLMNYHPRYFIYPPTPRTIFFVFSTKNFKNFHFLAIVVLYYH